MDTDARVCPECGEGEFKQRVYEARVYTGQVIGATGEFFDADDGEIQSSEREHDQVECTNCGWDGDPSDTITRLEYEAEEEGDDE